MEELNTDQTNENKYYRCLEMSRNITIKLCKTFFSIFYLKHLNNTNVNLNNNNVYIQAKNNNMLVHKKMIKCIK